MVDPIEPKKSNHQANIIRIDAIIPHPDPETTDLELIDIRGYQVVVRKGQFHVGDLGVYIQPDSVVPQTDPFRFLWDGHEGLDGKVPAKYRRVTVRKFRKQVSEGLLLPISDFASIDFLVGPCGERSSQFLPQEGDDVSDVLGITHYEPEEDASTSGNNAAAPRGKRKYPKTVHGWFRFLYRKFLQVVSGRPENYTMGMPIPIPTYDVDAYKNHINAFEEGEDIVVTEKVHGSNARFMYLDDTMYAGSRNQWKHANSPCIFRRVLKDHPWIESWCRENPGLVLWGEVVPTQAKYDYGTKKGETKFLAFDIYEPETGSYFDYEIFQTALTGQVTDAVTVPLLFKGKFSTKEALIALADGKSQVHGAKHIREGFVARTVKERKQRGLGRTQLKVVSNEFLAKDGKI